MYAIHTWVCMYAIHTWVCMYAIHTWVCMYTIHTNMGMYMHVHVVEHSVYGVECRGFESHPRQMGEYVSTQTLVIGSSFFLRKSDCLGCAVLLCLVVCLTLLASLFLPSHLSLKHVYTYPHNVSMHMRARVYM